MDLAKILDSEPNDQSQQMINDKCLSKEPNMTSNTLNKRKSKGLKSSISSNQSENIKNYFSPKNKVGLLETKKMNLRLIFNHTILAHIWIFHPHDQPKT